MGKKKRKTKNRQQKQILADHERKGKMFIPPFLAKLGPKIGFIRWTDDLLPEMLWIALLFDTFPERRAIEVAEKFAVATKQVLQPKKAHSFAFISEYDGIDAAQAEKIRELLSKKGVLEDLQSSLFPLVSLYSKCPLGFLLDENARIRHRVDVETALVILKRVVSDCFDRKGRPAMIVQTTATYLMLITGELKIFKGCGLENIDDIFDYPETEESKKLAALVRAGLNVPIFHEDEPRWWCSYFWQHGYGISVCEFPERTYAPVSDEDKQKVSKLIEAAQSYRQELFGEIQEGWTRAAIDLARPLRDEVLGGLIARQARLATAIACDPQLWSVDISRILLRCMVDTHITLVWLASKGSDKDFEHFVEYGLGQEKLLLEHLKSQLDNRHPQSMHFREKVDGMQAWINSQLLSDFLPVNVGSWTKKTTRQMAEETDSLEVFNLSYTPFSSVLHGSWNAIARLNLEFCINPLHRFHRVPSLEEPPMYVGMAEQAGRIMDASFRAWEQAKGIKPLASTASERFLETAATVLKNS